MVLAGCGNVGDAEDTTDSFRADLDRAILVNYRIELGDAVAACMAERGFEFIPSSVAGTQMIEDLFSMPEESFIEEFGYGVVTLVDPETGEPAFADPDAVHPNDEVFEQLDLRTRRVYLETLYGELDDPEFSVLTPPGGCYRDATAELGAQQTDALEQLQQSQAELEERILSDPRMVDAVIEWSRCMSELGWVYSSPNDGVAEITAAASELMVGQTNPMAAWDDDEFAEFVQLHPSEMRSQLLNLSGIDRDGLVELQSLEREIAAADNECRQEHLTAVESSIRAELEPNFLEQNRQHLDRITEQLETTGAGS